MLSRAGRPGNTMPPRCKHAVAVSRRREAGANFRVVRTRGFLVMDRDFATLPLFIACMTFTLIIALTHVLG